MNTIQLPSIARLCVGFAFGLCTLLSSVQAFTPSQAPTETQSVPANLLMALSVEFPTGITTSYRVAKYTVGTEYLGYFDSNKCYSYNTTKEVFLPDSGKVKPNSTKIDGSCPDANDWDGNILNFLVMNNLDQFRSVMTGGTRDNFSNAYLADTSFGGDDARRTILIRAFSDRNGSSSNNLVKIIPKNDDTNTYDGTKVSDFGVPSSFQGKNLRSGGYGTRFLVQTGSTAFPDWGANDSRMKETCAAGLAAGRYGAGNTCFNIRVAVCEPVPAVGSAPAVEKEANCKGPYPSANFASTPWTAATSFDVGDKVRVLSSGAEVYPGLSLVVTTAGTSGTSAPNLSSRSPGDTFTDGSVTWRVLRFYYKPEGLIQEYGPSIRFGAMGYLKDDTRDRPGGVIRATMRSVGPTLVGQGGGSNPNPEWDLATGFIVPNPTSSDDSNVNNSGVINYLNKFGYESGYKTFDPIGELYYASQLYLRNKPLPSRYTSMTSPIGTSASVLRDGFPVITSPADPMILSCQKNFILGIGDKNTHCDGALPGSTDNGGSTCAGQGGNPTDPDGLNVSTLWNSITGYEGNSTWVAGATQAKPWWAGLAWWANTSDIRPDLNGKQTITTFFVDVMEGNQITDKTSFWWATKYGGFNTSLVTGDNPNTSKTSWDKDPTSTSGDNVPDTLFAGNNPKVLRESLIAAFTNIYKLSSDASASAAAVTSKRQTSSSQIIYAGYNPKFWTGGVRGCTPQQTAAQCQDTPYWEATNWFDPSFTGSTASVSSYAPKLTNLNRKIFTSTGNLSTFAEMPFQWASLNSTQKGVLNGSDSLGEDRLDYLRGSRIKEGSLFRTRGPDLMGDVVNSNVTDLAGPGPLYRGPNFAGHATYRAKNVNRPGVVYVGANDGKLHALSGTTGKELWAYIPGTVFENLPLLTAQSYKHRYFVDSTAMVADTQTGDTSNPWRTMLVGGLGGGGKAYYALDITKQTPDSSGKSFANMTEAELASIPMWEFTTAQDSDLGYTYNEPPVDAVTGAFKQIAKVADASVATGVWRVVVSNGYGSPSDRAVLYFLNSETGVVANKLIATASGSGDNGLSSPTPMDTDGDGLVDTVYAGDLRGNMHKFQFSELASNGSDYILASAGKSGASWRYIGRVFSAGRPITAAPVVTKACPGNTGWQVMFGTGKLNEDPDFLTTTSQAFYSVLDNNASSSLTVSDSDLAVITPTQSTVTAGTVRNWSTPSLTNKKGWRINFTGGERIISNPTIPPDSGSVLFGTAKPNADLCTPGSAGFLMSANICTGGIGGLTVVDSSGELFVGGFGVTASGILKVSNTYTNLSNQQQIVCNQQDCQRGASGSIIFKGVNAPKGRYSWRELSNRKGP